MDRESAKKALLEYGWDAAERRRIADVLHAVENDPECRRTVAEYDRIRAALKPAETEVEPADGWDAFEDRLRGTVTDRRTRVWLKASALAAAVLLATIAGWQVRRDSASDRELPPGESAAAHLTFAPQEIRSSVSVFREVSGVFDQRASWVLVSGETSDLGLGADPSQPKDRLLLLRLTLSSGSEVVSSSDLVIVPGQGAELTLPFEGGRRLYYSIATTPDEVTHLSLWVELGDRNGAERTLAILATDLPVEPGEVLGAGEMVTTTGRYALNVAFARADLTGVRP